jgi:general secretion pathway protein A
MYKDFFRLNEMPFSIAPDPRFLFMSTRHREAMAHLLYGVQGEGGIVLLTGEVGTGKTTICRSLLEQIPENVDVALILNPRMSVEELLQTICEEFHIDVSQERPGIKTFVDALNTRLLSAHAQGRRAILIVDEAQNLDATVLEQLRLLTNLETNTRKLLQIFLIGQPELQNMLARSEMRQVSQRVIARYHLTHLSPSEVNSYVAHRLRISGASPLIFSDALIKKIYRASGGVPRLINLICDRALLGAYVQGHQQITLPILRQAVNEIMAENPRRQRLKIIVAILLALVACAAFLLATQLSDNKLNWIYSWLEDKPAKSAAVTSTPQVAALAPVATTQITPTSQATALAPLTTTQPAPTPANLPASTLKWPGNISVAGSESLAFQTLFKLYGIRLDRQSKESPCHQAESSGLRCYAARGGISDLLQLDQPVLIRLSSPEGKELAATLIALDHQNATLILAGEEQRVPLSVLASAWFGQFVVIWNPPKNFNGEVLPNKRGPAVVWLRQAMQAVDGIADNGSDIFDADLARRVRAFQLTDGIQPDGVVGPLTVIRLNVRSGKGGPRLVTEKRG